MSEPFYPAKSGDPILADTWNNMQIKLRDEVRTHTHRGADDGKQLDGDAILPTASLRVNRVDASVALTVKGIDVLTRLTELGTSITGLGTSKLNVTGGAISGGLTVTGSLGIGNASPGSRLDIQGAARSGTHGSNRTLYVTGDFGPEDGVEFRHSNGTQGLGFGYNTVYAVGSNPDQDLNLKARGNGVVRIANGALMPRAGNSAAAGIQFPSNPGGGGSDEAFIRYYAVSGETTKLLIGTENDPDDSIGLWQAGAERLTVINGRIGIGTADPLGPLDVRIPGGIGTWDRLVVTTSTDWGDGATQYVTIGAGGAAGIMLRNPHVVWQKEENRASIRYGRSGGVATGRWWDVGVRTGNAFSVALENSLHALWLTQEGRVGIGTTSPGKTLTVVHPGPGNNNAAMEVRGEGTHSWGIGLVVRTTAGQDGASIQLRSRNKSWQVKGEVGATATGFQICEDGGDAELGGGFGEPRFHISAGGNIGMGTTAPQTPLHIQQRIMSGIRLQEHNGTGRFFNIYLEGQGTVVFYHETGSGQFMMRDGLWRLNSDVSLKENISSVQGVLDRVLALRPVSFDWKATGTRSIGLVAQDVEPLFPELVGEVEPEQGRKIKGIAYQTLGVLAVAALQELKRQYDEKLQSLEARLQSLR